MKLIPLPRQPALILSRSHTTTTKPTHFLLLVGVGRSVQKVFNAQSRLIRKLERTPMTRVGELVERIKSHFNPSSDNENE